jgi:hypothetical protein
VLAGNGQGLAVLLPVLEQIALIIFEGRSSDLGRCNDSTSSTPFQKHFHVNTTDSQRALAEALHRKMLKILIQQCGKRRFG